MARRPAIPVAAELLRAIERHALPHELLSGMIDAHRFDLYDEPMQTSAELESYLQGTASALFGLGALVLGVDAQPTTSCCVTRAWRSA